MDTAESNFIPAKTRWLAILAGCVSAAFGIPAFSPLYLLFVTPLILGAIVQPRAPTTGRWLIWVGVLILSYGVVPLGYMGLLELPKMLRQTHDTRIILMSTLMAMSTLLVVWCNIALAVEAFRRRPSGLIRGRLDWVPWMAAIALSAWCVLMLDRGLLYAYRHGRPDILYSALALNAIVLFFDVALVAHAFKTRRALYSRLAASS